MSMATHRRYFSLEKKPEIIREAGENGLTVTLHKHNLSNSFLFIQINLIYNEFVCRTTAFTCFVISPWLVFPFHNKDYLT